MKQLIAFALTLLFWSTAVQAANFYVAVNGNDTWSGTLATPNKKKTDGPFATLERARDEMRKLKKESGLPKGGVTVELRGGVYERAQAFELTAEDSGTAEAPVTYRAKKGEEVRLVGGKVVTGWKPVTDPAVLGRLDESARGKVVQADLKVLGITDFGDVAATGKRLEFFFQDKPMTVARWPNDGFVKIVDLVGGDPMDVRGTKGDKIGKFTYNGDRPKRWKEENDVWLHGYWFWDWSDQRHKLESIDMEKHIIAVMPPYHGYGYRKGQWYYAFNVLAELDRPGEWYLKRDNGILYFWPPEDISKAKASVSVIPALVTMKDASYVTLRGMILEATRNTAVTLTGGTGSQVVACTIRNTGAWAVNINGGKENGVVGCDIYETANGGISMYGGDRNALTPAGLFADNNHIHHYSRWDRVYQPGINLQGVGNRASHNLIDNAPHMAMGFGGNDHLIEFNEIHSVSYESNDAGAIYTGRNWTMRGTVIRHNYLHHINGFEGRGCVGVYLDDQFSGTLIYGNLFYNVTRAAMIGGGRDCTIENNIFVDCVPATHVDARGLGWAASGFEGLKASLLKSPHKASPWKERYPQLVNILDEDPMAPKGNVIARNVCVGGRWGDFEAKAKPMVTFQDNLLDQDPLFVDAEKLNFQLRDDSPAYKLGFKKIPIEQIGLYKDGRRASWPVQHKVREMVTAPVARRQGPPPLFKVAKATTAPQIDGTIKSDEWNGADPTKAMVLEQSVQGEKLSPKSIAWVMYDNSNLYIAFDNTVNKSKPLRKGQTWGQDDAVEVALRDTAAGKDAPIFVLRGFPNGHFDSSDEAGASEVVAREAGQGVKYQAKVVDAGRWTAEFQIPFASLSIDPTKHNKLAFNLTVRKSADGDWVLWCGTNGYSWAVDSAGFIELVR